MMGNNRLVYIAIRPGLFEEIRFADHLPALQSIAMVERWEGSGDPPLEVVQDAINRAEVLVTGWGTPGTAEVLGKSWSTETSPLRLLAHTAGSIHHLVNQETVNRGLLVTHAYDAIGEAVAEITLGAFISMRRQMFLAAEHFKKQLPAPGFQMMNELPGSVIGIIGASSIGRRVMKLLQPWQVKILLYDPYINSETAASLGAELVNDLVELFRRSDIVSLHAPITSQTVGMLRVEHFQAMKDGALFVNTARGKLVNHAGLLAELQTGRISALLDVTDPTEPLPPDSPFLALENCVVLPHLAGHSIQARIRQGKYIAEEVQRYLAGKPLQYRVKTEKMTIMA
jgi:phosphoglycerate dehydrogenase-like enzyme